MRPVNGCLFGLFFLMQFLHAQPRTFLRLYNASGNKISKGYLYQTTDSSIIIACGKKHKEFRETPITQIEVIKSSRTLANHILTAPLIFITVVVVMAGIIVYVALIITDRHGGFNSSSGNKSSAHTTRTYIKPQKKYVISGEPDIWKNQRVLLNQLL
ncbi:MAG: hypothetical protein ABIU77_11440 [Ferruginibacter sp.]